MSGAGQAERGSVYLVGAGPGSLDLLTLRAHALIASATCVLHDDLVTPEVLSAVSPHALVRNVGKRCGTKTVTQEQIHRWMIGFAEEGHSVVRLKSGDPLLFARAAEELEALRRAGIPFAIVPGVTAGFAAAALAGLPLTGRISNSRVLFTTRHLAAGTTGSLRGITPEVTLALYMPGKDYASLAAELLANGWPLSTRCVVASALGTPMQRHFACTLGELDGSKTLPSPALMLFFPGE